MTNTNLEFDVEVTPVRNKGTTTSLLINPLSENAKQVLRDYGYRVFERPFDMAMQSATLIVADYMRDGLRIEHLPAIEM